MGGWVGGWFITWEVSNPYSVCGCDHIGVSHASLPPGFFLLLRVCVGELPGRSGWVGGWVVVELFIER